MTGQKRDIGASVTARLLNRAKKTGGDYQNLLAGFCFERFLFRLGISTARDRFVLKGAMLLRLWSDQPYRATRDLDLLRKGDGSWNAIRTDIESICAVDVEPDAVSFDPASLRVEAIRPEDEYAGARATLHARCGTARLALQIDMGLGDSVWPAPQPCTYPALLDSLAEGSGLSTGSGHRREARGDRCTRRPQQPHQGFLRHRSPRASFRVRPRDADRGDQKNLRTAPDSRADRRADRVDCRLLAERVANTSCCGIRSPRRLESQRRPRGRTFAHPPDLPPADPE